VIERLAEGEVELVVTGRTSDVRHSVPVMTQDVDICYDRSTRISSASPMH
jgi:hypothetical protein